MRVLVIEDDAVFRRGLAQMFPKTQYDVTQAENGQEACNLIEEQRPDLVICDYRLPGADGLAVLSHLRHVGLPTPFILVTAHYSEELATLAHECGATAVCEKPIELDQFRQQCQLALGRRTIDTYPGRQ